MAMTQTPCKRWLQSLVGLSAILLVGTNAQNTGTPHTQRTVMMDTDAVLEETLAPLASAVHLTDHVHRYDLGHKSVVGLQHRDARMQLREEDSGQNGSSDSLTNCTSPQNPPRPLYNNSCQFVHAACTGQSQLLNYLAFVVCSLSDMKPLGYVLLALWMAYLIALLATTVDYFFVAPLTFLCEKMKLSPSISGITLMALGNAAPDIFVVYSGVAQDDMALVLGSLVGGGTFITTVVLGTVMFVTRSKPLNLDKFDLIRDIMALIVVSAVVIIVAFDGTVHLIEACMFPLIYAVYIVIVIGISYVREYFREKPKAVLPNNEALFWDTDKTVSLEKSLPLRLFAKALFEETHGGQLISTNSAERANLPGLTWPSGSHIVIKTLWFIQWPFSLLRWMTIPPFAHDGHWSKWHWFFAVSSPIPMAMLLLLATKGWNGFTINVGRMPLPVILILTGGTLTIVLSFLIKRKHPPHWSMQLLLVPLAFCMSIMWLNIEANEIVSVLRAFGLLLNIDTAVLGLTVLAVGNSVADWVADTVIARCGRPEMAYSSCFGSPMMSNVMGLSVALIVKISMTRGEPYQFHIHTPEYSLVKLSWIFLGISLISSLFLFPLSRFSPKRAVGVFLMVVYALFVLFAVLGESGVMPLNL